MDAIDRYSLHCLSADGREETINESSTWGDTELLLDWYRSVKPLGQTRIVFVRSNPDGRIGDRVTICGVE
ncbi:MAG TPA: hypothetical protein VHU83_24595 [Bryobacteraceae bacterium]|jgi:hypothetical protein|nr:hypothetical protein [Bryobacteraceae bacterium]